jgi:hypothetical protein
MATIITEYRFLEPIDDEKISAIARDLDPALARRDAAWKRSYLSDDRLRMICEFDGKDVGSVEAAHQEESVPYEAVYAAQRFTAEEMQAAHEHEQIEPMKEIEDVKKKVEPAFARP